MTYAVEPMTGQDIALAVDWAAAEGWNPGLADAGCFAAADAGGFFGGYLDGRMIGSVSVVTYDAAFAFLGFYIVVPEYRGQGYGHALWKAAWPHAGDRLVGLDGVVQEQAAYARSGFVLAYRNIRFGGPRPPALPSPWGVGIAAVEGLTAEIEDYDRPLFPAPRPAFLRAWLSAPGHHVRVARRAGRIAGYGVVRPCRTGWKIGPLFADDREVAEALAGALLAEVRAGEEIFLDAPEPNGAATALAEALGLAPVFETARMYTGPAPEIDLGRVFGVTSFELG